jgi:hypothetical protein
MSKLHKSDLFNILLISGERFLIYLALFGVQENIAKQFIKRIKTKTNKKKVIK